MQNPERKFVGGIKRVEPRNIHEREKVDYQRTEIFGLNQDFLNGPLGVEFCIRDYQETPTRKNLEELVSSTIKLKTYEEWIQDRATPETHPAVFADDVLPYIRAIDEIVANMKQLAHKAEQKSDSGNKNQINPLVLSLKLDAAALRKIIQSSVHKKVSQYSLANDLSTDPIKRKLFHNKEPLPESEALEKITKRLMHGKKVLAGGPLKGSFSQIMENGDVLPVDWEPKGKDKENLRGSGQKET